MNIFRDQWIKDIIKLKGTVYQINVIHSCRSQHIWPHSSVEQKLKWFLLVKWSSISLNVNDKHTGSCVITQFNQSEDDFYSILWLFCSFWNSQWLLNVIIVRKNARWTFCLTISMQQSAKEGFGKDSNYDKLSQPKNRKIELWEGTQQCNLQPEVFVCVIGDKRGFLSTHTRVFVLSLYYIHLRNTYTEVLKVFLEK